MSNALPTNSGCSRDAMAHVQDRMSQASDIEPQCVETLKEVAGAFKTSLAATLIGMIDSDIYPESIGHGTSGRNGTDMPQDEYPMVPQRGVGCGRLRVRITQQSEPG